MTIEATATQMKLVEARGESRFKIDGKNATVDVPGARIKVKSKWDRGKLLVWDFERTNGCQRSM